MTILYSNIFNTLDLHGETLEVAMYLVKGFISDNIKMKNEYIAIIHGNGKVLKSNLLKCSPDLVVVMALYAGNR